MDGKMSDVLNNFITYLIDYHATWNVDEYGDNILSVNILEDEKEDIVKDFLFREFPNKYPNEINFRI